MFTFDDWHKLVLQCVNAKGSRVHSGTTRQAGHDAAVLFCVRGL